MSVYVICYNQAAYIRQCIDSILAQKTDFDFEAIIIDDCSTDGTSEILAGYATRNPETIVHIRNPYNRYAERFDPLLSIFLPRARGEYTAFLEGDDFWSDPRKLQQQADLLDSRPEVGSCVTNYHWLDEAGGESHDIILSRKTRSIPRSHIFSSHHIHGNTIMCRTYLLRDASNLREARQKISQSRDHVTLATLAPHGIVCLPIFGLTYRVCPSGIFTSAVLRHKKEPEFIYLRHIDIFDAIEPYFPALRRAFAKSRGERCLHLYHIFKSNRRQPYMPYLFRAIKYSPAFVMRAAVEKVCRMLKSVGHA